MCSTVQCESGQKRFSSMTMSPENDARSLVPTCCVSQLLSRCVPPLQVSTHLRTMHRKYRRLQLPASLLRKNEMEDQSLPKVSLLRQRSFAFRTFDHRRTERSFPLSHTSSSLHDKSHFVEAARTQNQATWSGGSHPRGGGA